MNIKGLIDFYKGNEQVEEPKSHHHKVLEKRKTIRICKGL